MLIEKVPLPDVDTPADAPPAYDALEVSTSTRPLSQPEKSVPPNLTIPYQLNAADARVSKGIRTSWFTFGTSARTTREIKTTVLALVRDVVKQPDITGCTSILQSCAEACRAHGLVFSALLQEQSMEGHSPLYWAVIKRPPEPAANVPDLVAALLALAAPLADTTLSEIRLACLQNSDQALFRRLLRSPAVSPLTGTDELLLGASVPSDEVDVQDVPGHEGAFVVQMRIPLFQRRMRVSKAVHLEFIARGRLWALRFLVTAPDDQRVGYSHHAPGTWVVTLALLEHSPPTWIDSRLIIEEPSGAPPSPAPAASADAPPESCPPRAKPISLRLKSGSGQLTPPAGRGRNNDVIVVSLGESLMANSLQYNGSSYISADGSMQARLEARLAKPEADCIIC